MGRGFQGVIMRAVGAKDHVLTVAAREYRADHMVRIGFRSDTLLNSEGEAPGNWIRAWFPDADGGAKLYQRGYTILDPEPETGEFTIDFVLHHPMGPASNWAAHCEIGDQILAMRYGEEPFTLLDPPPAGYLFLGDLAGYPAITSIVESIPRHHEVVVYLERHSEADEELPLPSGPNITAAWVPELPDGQALVRAISHRAWTGWYAWVTGESTSTRHAKTLLQREHDLTRATLHTTAYWARGRQMGRVETLEETTPSPATDLSPTHAAAGTTGATASPTLDGNRTSEPPREHGRSRGILSPAKVPLIVSGCVQALLSVLQVVPFILFAEVARMFLDSAPREDFVTTGMWAMAIMVVSTLGIGALMFAMHLYDARFSAALRRRLMDKLSGLPLGWFSSRGAGEVRKLVGNDVTALHYVVVHSVSDVVAAVVAPITVMVYLFSVEWRLGLVMLLPVFAYIQVMIRISRRDADKAVEVRNRVAASASGMQSFIASHEVSRVFGDDAVVDIHSTLRRHGDLVEGWQRETGPLKIVAVMINRPTTVLGVLVLAGSAMLVPSWISGHDLIPFLILGTSFGGQLMGISMSVYGLVQALEAKAGLELLLDTPELPAPADRPVPEGHVVFDRVRFGYGPERDVLSDFSLRLEPGTLTAVVGPSGAGKSTVASLLARLWDVDAGSVSIDGRDVRDMTADELYSRVTILLQDVQLIHASIRENIALTDPESDDDRIETVARVSRIHDRIAELPDGYDTVVTTDQLSGGERQRIGIARALLADTPVVVLDEATAAADPDSEWAIRQGLDRLLEGRTVLMIAHRLHTITHADRIVVMDDGEVREAGTHADLLASGGVYARLWNATSYEEVS